MVHSDSDSPMTTQPRAPPHLTTPAAAAPPLQETPPLVPRSGETTNQDPSWAPAKLTSTEHPANLVSTPPSTPSPAVAEAPVLTPAKTPTTYSSLLTPSQASPQTPTPAQVLANGRTSGRKRTPKACDCCGPNGRGHDVKPAGRGRGRGGGKGKGTLVDTPKRKASQLTHTSKVILTEKKEEEAKDGSKAQKKALKTVAVADTQSDTAAPPAVTSPQGGAVTNCAAPDNPGSQKEEDMLLKDSVDPCEEGKGGGENNGLEIKLSGVVGKGAGSGMAEAKLPSNLKVDIGIQRWGDGVFVVGTKKDFAPQSKEVKDAELEPEVQTHSNTVKSPIENGDTVSLSDSEPEGEAKDNGVLLRDQGSVHLTGPRQTTSTPHESEMQVDQDHGSSPVPLTNGMDHDHGTTPMEVETPRLNQGPIAVSECRHHWALRDHRLYCQPGTWEENKSGEAGTEGETQREESLEQLTDMVHEFLESFYMKYGSFIPLSEADVLEHLKKNGHSDLSKRAFDVKGEVSRYRSGLASVPVAGFTVMHNKHNLSLEDLGTLEEQNWLNDQIINMYGELIMEDTQHKVHFFNSFFHKQLVAKGYDGVKRWTKKVDLFSKWLLLIPIHLEIHWSLVTVTMATKTISYYDSQGIVFRHTTDNIMKYLQSEAREKDQTAFQKGWKIAIIKGIPQQKNDSDCGVFVLEYCRRLSVKKPLLFSQEDMPRIRKRIYKELCDRRLDD